MVAAILILSLVQTPAAPVRTVPFIDLNRYLGDWYEVARYPNRFQTQCLGDVRASYAKRADGRLDVINSCRTASGVEEAKGVARIEDTKTFARLKVRFAPAWLSFLSAVWGDYWIIGLAADYSWAVVGSPDRNYLWVLSRTAQLSPAAYDAALATARSNGFDVSNLVRTPQGQTVAGGLKAPGYFTLLATSSAQFTTTRISRGP